MPWAAHRVRFLRPARLGVLVGIAVASCGCGKKGPPLAPLQRVPAAVGEWTATRRDDVVLLSFVVPGTNVGGDRPADVAAVEVYAVTAARAPDLDEGRVPPALTLVSTTPVRRPVPPPAPDATGDQPDVPPLPREPGVDQGTRVTVQERLTPAVSQPVAESRPRTAPTSSAEAPSLSLPVVYIDDPPKRHYVAVAVSRSGRRSAWSSVASVPLATPSGAPTGVGITYDASTFSITWQPGPGARLAPREVEGFIDLRPLGPAPTPTRFNVYPADAGATGEIARLNEAPLAATAFDVPGVAFGVERCFVVRPVDAVDGVDFEGPASEPACETPRDTFPPPAPAALEAVGGAGLISLIWESVEAPDLAGYLVFRGEAGSDPTTQLTPAPITASSFEDKTVTPGTRYVYVVVAIDSATPPNRSTPSNSAEETARQ